MGALTAVPAQDFFGGNWVMALGVRGAATDVAVTAAFDAGKIFRTHVFRSTQRIRPRVQLAERLIDASIHATGTRLTNLVMEPNSKPLFAAVSCWAISSPTRSPNSRADIS